MNTSSITVKRTIQRMVEDELATVVPFGDQLRAHLDSLDIIELLMMLEEHYDIDIDDSVALEWNTLDDATNYIEEAIK